MKERNKIYLFRHGQTFFNRDKKFTGNIDSKLTSKGKEHAKTIAKKLKNKRFQVAIHTSLSRSIDTLKPVLKNHPECTIIIEDDRILERDYGSLQGMNHIDYIKKYGEEEFKRVHRNFTTRPPKGESFADVEIRVREFIKDLKRFIKKNKVNIAISGHGNSIRLFRKIIDKKTRKEAEKWNIPYDKVFEYKI